MLDNVNNLSDKEKIELINKIDSVDEYPNSLDILEHLSIDENQEIRWTVAETLMEFDDIRAEQILSKLLYDENETVRVCACESLRYAHTSETFHLLKDKLINDKSGLVRGYAALSMTEIAIAEPSIPDFKLVPLLKECLDKEKNVGVIIRIYKSLCSLGESQFLKLLLNKMNTRDYRNRAAVANLVRELISDENKDLVLSILKERLTVEKTRAVTSIIEEVIKEFES